MPKQKTPSNAKRKKRKPVSKKRRVVSRNISAKQRIHSGVSRIRAQATKGRKRRNLLKVLDQEPEAVKNFAKRAISKGAKAKTAIRQGRILHESGRINEAGKLKTSGGKRLSIRGLKKLIGG